MHYWLSNKSTAKATFKTVSINITLPPKHSCETDTAKVWNECVKQTTETVWKILYKIYNIEQNVNTKTIVKDFV